MLTKKVSILGGIGLACLATISYCQAKTQAITVKNMTNKNLVIQIIRPDQRPCNSIQEAVAARETRDFLISGTCPLTQFKVLGSSANSEKVVNQLTFGTYTKFLIKLNHNGDDIVVAPFTQQDQSWYRKGEQARKKLEEQERENQKAGIGQI
jgi:hypothetical protein